MLVLTVKKMCAWSKSSFTFSLLMILIQ